jgi:hypothetical protein
MTIVLAVIIMAMLTKPRGVRQVQRQLRPISAPSLSKNYGCPLVMDMA